MGDVIDFGSNEDDGTEDCERCANCNNGTFVKMKQVGDEGAIFYFLACALCNEFDDRFFYGWNYDDEE
jgi:hypothetical protein